MYFTNLTNRVLLLDSWPGNCERDVQDLTLEGITMTLQTIPKGHNLWMYTVLDCGKSLSQIFRHCFVGDIQLNYRMRYNIIKLQSLVHIRFPSPRFHRAFQYAWYKSGYIEQQAPPFKMPVNFRFNKNEKLTCDMW